MKNKTFILTFIATAGVAASAFAGPTLPASIISTRIITNNEVPMGHTSYNKEGGILTRSVMGQVTSVNAGKNAFVVEDKHCITKAAVSTDSKTAASLQPGQIVTVKLRANNPVAQLVSTGSSARSTAVPFGKVSYNKEGGIQVRTLAGEVQSVNAAKGVFVVGNKHDGITATISADAGTIASLQAGQKVVVKTRSDSQFAQAVTVLGN